MKQWFFYICANQEFSSNLHSETKEDPAFISKGYSNWKKAMQKFDDQQSNCHKATVSFEVTVRQYRDFQVIHDTQILKEQELERRYFRMILKTTQTLARQGVSFQGHSNNDYFTQLFLLLAKDDPEVSRRLLDLPGTSKSKEILL